MESIHEPQPLSEGEQAIEQFFKDCEIEYSSLHKITNLKGDSLQYREADFYLPQFKMYVEFFGKWNVSESEKNRYREKKRVYNLNGIPCIYFYPENLGLFEHLFILRMEKELTSRKMRTELIRFKFHRLQGDFLKHLIYFFSFSGFLFLWLTKDNFAAWAVEGRNIILGCLLGLAGLVFYNLLKIIVKVAKVFRAVK